MTTAGGVEEDLIKCLAPTFIGDFNLDGRSLRENGINRIGNLLVPNDNYCKFQDWVTPILDSMLKEQREQVTVLGAPSSSTLISETILVTTFILAEYSMDTFKNCDPSWTRN